MADQRSRGQRIRDFLNNRTGDSLKGFGEGFNESSENIRNLLLNERLKRGKDEPLQAISSLSKSQAGEAVREILTAYGLPGGFTDSMLMERTRQGVGLNPDPTAFDGISIRKLNPEGIYSTKKSEADAAADVQQMEQQKLKVAADNYREKLRAEKKGRKIGQFAGRLASDVTLDGTRGIYWLLNAAQATGKAIGETVMNLSNPNLITSRIIDDNSIRRAEAQKLIRLKPSKIAELNRLKDSPDWAIKEAEIRSNPASYEPSSPSVFTKGSGDDRVITQRRINNNLLASLGLGATAFAINKGIGLFDRPEGYAASVPSELDPRETENVLAEVASKYLMSRPGNMNSELMAYERPDVSPQERARYQAYKYDKELDLNIFDDGKVNILGVLKTNPEGVHGAELNVFGRGLGFNETILPTLGAFGGLALGGVLPNIRQIRRRGARPEAIPFDPNNPLKTGYRLVTNNIPVVEPKTWNREIDSVNPLIKQSKAFDNVSGKLEDFFTRENETTGQRDMDVFRTVGSLGAGTIGGLALATAAGNQMEYDRRKKGFEERFGTEVDYDTYKSNAQKLLNEKYKRIKENPRDPDKESKVKFNKRNEQEVLLANAAAQQTLIDQLINEERRERAQRANAQREQYFNEFDTIEDSFKN